MLFWIIETYTSLYFNVKTHPVFQKLCFWEWGPSSPPNIAKRNDHWLILGMQCISFPGSAAVFPLSS